MKIDIERDPQIPDRVKKNTLFLLNSGKQINIACIAFSIALIHQLLGLDELSWKLHAAAIFISIALPLLILGLHKVGRFSSELHDFNYLHDVASKLGVVSSVGIYSVGASAIFTVWHFSGVAAFCMLVSLVVGCFILEPGVSPSQNFGSAQQEPETDKDKPRGLD